MTGGWTVVRVRGSRGEPTLDGLDFLGCVAAVRQLIGSARWHYRWVTDDRRASRDGLRVEMLQSSPELARLLRGLETRVPPPDSVFAEPMHVEAELDPVQREEELDVCLALLWRYSEFLADLRVRNPHLRVQHIRGLSPGAFQTFITGDGRHLESALDAQGVKTVPVVALRRVIELVRAHPMPYRVPPSERQEAVDAARIHHLMGCTFASEYYPFARFD